MTAPLWGLDAMAAAMRAERCGPLPAAVSGISIDTRSIAPGEAFFAIRGDNRDGHAFVKDALQRGASLAVIAQDRRDEMPAGAPLLVVQDVLEGLIDLARAARARTTARIAAITGSVGKTGTKEALRLALSEQAQTHGSAASYNNHWGVPLSLARMPESARFGVFEIGMNHAGEITPLTQLVRPHITVITTIEPVHIEHLGSIEAIADAKAEIFAGLEKGGAAVLNRDNGQFARLAARAKATGVARIISFGEHLEADARLLQCSLQADCSTVRASVLGQEITYKVGAPGRHLVMNSLAVLATAVLLGADLALSAVALAKLQPPVGRGARIHLSLPRGEALLIDESYNANPASMRAALAVLGQTPPGPRGRRIAVLGDMLELGPQGPELHAGLLESIVDKDIDLVFSAGPLMRNLWDVLPHELRGGCAHGSAELAPQILAEVRDGDVLMVKGSLGSRMGAIVTALSERYGRRTAREPATVES